MTTEVLQMPQMYYATSEMIGVTAGLRDVWKAIQTVAATDSGVLVHGDTGTGKELVARAIHEQSRRRLGAFVRLNCAAVPAGLLESELFGHERGAFTGAVTQTTGRFHLANHGTLFLDEIGDLPLELQPKLLRVLQEQEFERLGSTRTIRVDVRVVAATNQNLPQMIHDKQFRADLYYRLNVFPINVPPLRDRPGDIPALARHFVSNFAARMGKDISYIPEALIDSLQRYDWPGNIRELQNLIERAVIMSFGPELNLPPGELRTTVTPSVPRSAQTLAEAEREHIVKVLNEVKWVVGGRDGAAVRLGLARTTLISRMNKLGIMRENGRALATAAG